MKILIFDSGVGGLTICQALTEQLPLAEQILLADNAYFPYGEMAEESLITRVSELLNKAAVSFKPDCIVIACNTVSTLVLNKVRSNLVIPIIGVVPAIKPAAQSSQSKVIGLLATPATINRSYTAELVKDHADECTLVSVGSTKLVELAEQRLRGYEVDLAEITQLMEPLIEAVHHQNLDTIVLGCTHFPLMVDVLAQVVPRSVNFVDSSSAIARQASNILLNQAQQESTVKKQTLNRCFFTDLGESNLLDNALERYGFRSAQMF